MKEPSLLISPLEAGRYILAVSGGLDSMVLLDLLSRQPDLQLIIAHFDHGIRVDSHLDERFVRSVAQQKELKYVAERAELGPQASEAESREVRYNFLRQLVGDNSAQGLITAHHQDDAIETAALNVMRGTNRRGLSAMKDNASIIRPLYGVSRKRILEYAEANGVVWREDPSNAEGKYARNKLRQAFSSSLKGSKRDESIKIIDKVAEINTQINAHVANISQKLYNNKRIARHKFIMLPPEICNELVAYWLRQNNVAQYDKQIIERLVVTIKTGKPNTVHNVKGQLRMELNAQDAHFITSR